MNKITVVVPRKKSRKLKKLLKDLGASRYIRLKDSGYYKYEVIVTDLQTRQFLDAIKEQLAIKPGNPLEEGYVTVHDTNLVAPMTVEKGKTMELEELIKKGAKRFIKFDRNYLLFTICSAMIACLGFQLDNLIVLIGAMLISPLMAPIMSVSYGLSRQNNALIKKGLKTELIGISLILVVSLAMSFLPNADYSLELLLADTNLFLILLLAVITGLVAANSFVTGGLEMLTGVAVSISLLPPLTNFVLLVLGGAFAQSINSLFTFMFNLLGMHLSALVFFHYINKKKK